MKTVVNKTHLPLKLHLPQGKVLHLGPHKEGQIQDHAEDAPSIKRHLEAGDIELREDRGRPMGEAHPGPSSSSEQTHGHHPKEVHKSGDR